MALRRYAPPLSSASRSVLVSPAASLPQAPPAQAAPTGIDKDARLAEFLELNPNCPVNVAERVLEAAGWEIPPWMRDGGWDAAMRREEAMRRSSEEDCRGFAVPPMELEGIRRCTRTTLFRQGGFPDQSCAVCLTNFEEGETLRALPCGHCFHDTCVDQWLLRSAHCPTCRRPVAKGACALHTVAKTRFLSTFWLKHRSFSFSVLCASIAEECHFHGAYTKVLVQLHGFPSGSKMINSFIVMIYVATPFFCVACCCKVCRSTKSI